VAELVYALALGASGATHGGSNPLPSTSAEQQKSPYLKGLFCLTFILIYDEMVPD